MKKTTFILFLILIGVSRICAQGTYLGGGVTDYGKPWFFTSFPAKNVFVVDSSGNKWIGTSGSSGGLVRLADTAWTLFNTTNTPFTNNFVRGLFAVGNKIYIGAGTKIVVYNNGIFSVLDTSANGNIGAAKAIFVKNNIVYCATMNSNILRKYDGIQWTNYASPRGFINAINIDNNNKIWIGCVSGLLQLSDTSWLTIDSTVSVNCLTLSDNNRMWVGTKDNGVFYFENGIKHSLQEIIPNVNSIIDGISSLAKVPGGEVYIPALYANADNVAALKGKLFKIINQNSYSVFNVMKIEGYENNNVIINWAVIDIDAQGKLWFVNKSGTSQNLYCITNENDLPHMYKTYEELDVNNVKAGYFYQGSMFWDLLGKAKYEIPKGSGKTSLFQGCLWIGGKDQSGQLHLAGEQFHQNGADFFAGPVMDSIYYVSESSKWRRIWKLNKHEIEFHINNWGNSTYVIPVDISAWPGNGDISKGQSANLAPYFDYNNNGIYDPQNGDYPKIKGDQAVYFLLNDDKQVHTETQGKKCKFEIHVMAYAYNTPFDTALNNTTFLSYRIINKSQNTYDSLKIGYKSDMDLGDATDDYIGCDTNLNSFYVYNGKSIDGTGQPEAYGGPSPPPPAQSVSFLNQHMSSFSYFNNGSCNDVCDPVTASQYYLYLTSHWKDGTHMKFGMFGHSADTAAINCNYMFPGYGTNGTWTEKQEGMPPGDRRGVGVVGPFTFHPGEEITVDLAFVWARANSGNEEASVTKLLQDIAHVKNAYDDRTSGVIKGRVRHIGGFLNANSATVRLYKANSTTGNYKYADMLSANGNFIFSNVDPGQYILKVSKISNLYPNILSTFYDTTTYWQRSAIIVLNPADTVNIMVNMKEKISVPNGNGKISGRLQYEHHGAKGVSVVDGTLAIGNPVTGGEIYIELEPDDEPIANTQTDSSGFYEISGLAENNSYRIHVALPGIPQISTFFGININSQHLDYYNLNFAVDTSLANPGIYKDTSMLAVKLVSFDDNFILYPNPANDKIIFESNENANIEIVNSQGQVVGIYKISKTKTVLNIHKLPSGVYFFKIRTDKEIITKKIIKQ